MWTVFCFSGNDRLDFIFAVPCAQCPKTDKAFLPGAFDGSVLSSFDLIALLFQLLKKGFNTAYPDYFLWVDKGYASAAPGTA